MTPVAHSIEALVAQAEMYSRTSLELAQLKALDRTTDVITSVISRISVIALASVFVLIFNLGVALLLGDILGKNYYGFFIVAAFYLVAAIIAHFFLSHWIKRPFSNLIITQALQQTM